MLDTDHTPPTLAADPLRRAVLPPTPPILRAGTTPAPRPSNDLRSRAAGW